MSKSVIDIIEEYLVANGYDGLTDCDECGCDLGDLAPCASWIGGCVPGHNSKKKCKEMGMDFYIVPGKRPGRKKETKR